MALTSGFDDRTLPCPDPAADGSDDLRAQPPHAPGRAKIRPGYAPGESRDAPRLGLAGEDTDEADDGYEPL